MARWLVVAAVAVLGACGGEDGPECPYPGTPCNGVCIDLRANHDGGSRGMCGELEGDAGRESEAERVCGTAACGEAWCSIDQCLKMGNALDVCARVARDQYLGEPGVSQCTADESTALCSRFWAFRPGRDETCP